MRSRHGICVAIRGSRLKCRSSSSSRTQDPGVSTIECCSAITKGWPPASALSGAPRSSPNHKRSPTPCRSEIIEPLASEDEAEPGHLRLADQRGGSRSSGLSMNRRQRRHLRAGSNGCCGHDNGAADGTAVFGS